MSHYSDIYYELNQQKFMEDASCERIKEKLASNLKPKEMIRIMFSNYIEKLTNDEIRELEAKYLMDADTI